MYWFLYTAAHPSILNPQNFCLWNFCLLYFFIVFFIVGLYYKAVVRKSFIYYILSHCSFEIFRPDGYNWNTSKRFDIIQFLNKKYVSIKSFLHDGITITTESTIGCKWTSVRSNAFIWSTAYYTWPWWTSLILLITKGCIIIFSQPEAKRKQSRFFFQRAVLHCCNYLVG